MPMIDADGCLLNVSVEGRDGGPTLMLSNSLGCTMQMWEPQMEALTQHFRVIRYDRRGHGKSERAARPLFAWSASAATCWRSSTISTSQKAHWCGLSMGGMVGQWLGANAPDRFATHRSGQHRLPLSRPDELAQPHQGGEAKAASPRSPIP